MIRWPGLSARRVSALTTSVDLHATLCDVFGVTPDHQTHGRSLVPLLEGRVERVRDHVLTGYWGREVQIVTDEYCYTRGSVGSGFELQDSYAGSSRCP